jgi:hypothetical protein
MTQQNRFINAQHPREKFLGKEHPNTADSMNHLAYLLYSKGDYDSTEPLYKRATSTRKSLGQGASRYGSINE